MAQENENTLLVALAHVLRRRRQAARMTQEELAYLSDRSARYVSLLETCRHQPTLETMSLLSIALGLSLTQFVSEIEIEAKEISRRERDSG